MQLEGLHVVPSAVEPVAKVVVIFMANMTFVVFLQNDSIEPGRPAGAAVRSQAGWFPRIGRIRGH